MLRLYDLTRTKPPSIISKNWLQHRFFPDDWKKGSIIPVLNKDSKQILNNYRPVSLSPIYTKIFEKLILDSTYEFIDKNNLLKSNQSEFRYNDSCIHQLFYIIRNIFSAFDANHSLEVCDVFLDLSKACHRICHDGLLYKLKSNRVNHLMYNVSKWSDTL